MKIRYIYIPIVAATGGRINFGIATPIVDFGVGFGGSLDPHLGGTRVMNYDNFGRNSKGYKTTGWV